MIAILLCIISTTNAWTTTTTTNSPSSMAFSRPSMLSDSSPTTTKTTNVERRPPTSWLFPPTRSQDVHPRTFSALRSSRNDSNEKYNLLEEGQEQEQEQEQGEVGASTVLSAVRSSRRGWFQQCIGKTTAAIVAAGTAVTMTQSTTSTPPALAATAIVSSAAVCDDTVSVWTNGDKGRTIYLLGTAHISKVSAQLAGQLVQDTTPTGVFVELDPKRLKPGSGILASKVATATATTTEDGNLDTPTPPLRQSRIIVPQIQQLSATTATKGETSIATAPSSATAAATQSLPPKSPTSTSSPSSNNPLVNAASMAVGKSIKGMYKQLDSAGFESGEEFVVAIKEGQKIGSDIVLGDRDVEITVRRLAEGLSKTDIRALLNPDSELEQSLQALLPSSSQQSAMMNKSTTGSTDDDEQRFKEEFTTFVETMKSRDNVRLIMNQLKRIAPFLYEALVSERDMYMAAGLNGLNELTSIVAVVGIAHVDGIESNLQMNGWKRTNPSCSKFR